MPQDPDDTSQQETHVRSGEPAPASQPSPSKPPIRGGQLGRYTILDKLGAGGMGEVFRAYDPSLERNIALKVLTLENNDPAVERRMLRCLVNSNDASQKCT